MPLNPPPIPMTLGDHLDELRRRLIFGLLLPVPVFITALVFGTDLLAFLLRPARESLHAAGLPAQMLAANPGEPFVAYLKVATLCALIVSAPWILYQAWCFVAPGLHKHERRFIYVLAPLSTILSFGSAVFVYKVLLPITLGFFIAFTATIAPQQTPTAPLTTETAQPHAYPVLAGDPADPAPGTVWINTDLRELRVALPAASNTDNQTPSAVRIYGTPLSTGSSVLQQFRIGEYIGMVFTLGLVFGIASQLPIALLVAHWVGLVEPKLLRTYLRHACMACACAGALLTPADPGSMVLMAFPLYGLYELSILLMTVLTPARVAGKADTIEPPDAGDE